MEKANTHLAINIDPCSKCKLGQFCCRPAQMLFDDNDYRDDDDAVNRIVHLQEFKAELVDKGWNLAMLRIEPPNAVRISKQ